MQPKNRKTYQEGGIEMNKYSNKKALNGNGKYSTVIESMLKTIWVYSYESEIKKLAELYEKAKKEQWNASSDIDWSIEVDLEKLALTSFFFPITFQEVWEELDDRKKVELATSNTSWVMSQILHGEQGALLVASQLVSSAPLYDEKLTAATQVIDEARHVEVFHRYLTTKMNKEFPITPHLEVLMKNILSEPRWYFKFVGMQVLVEGLAMGIFGTLERFEETLLVEIVRYVMKDEARHVAFGVISLKEHIDQLPTTEKKELVEFAYEGCVHLRNRIVDQSMVWEDVGLPTQRMQEIVERSPVFQDFLMLMFARVVPNLKKLGLLPDYIRPHYENLGILKYEDLEL
ncbi:MAG: ferritin-like domain-containing protein [Candidatus Calescibacterium sp.]|nr:ferritin-like domain-containing protein [Candidatus Calescibacterium sp.]